MAMAMSKDGESKGIIGSFSEILRNSYEIRGMGGGVRMGLNSV